jgi:hypothetical protein
MRDSDLVLIPVRGSQVAGIAVGWLAVALSMAAIGSASVARVGGDVAEPQTQITVWRSITTGNSGASLAPAVDTSRAMAALTQPGFSTVSVVQSAKPLTSARTPAAPVSSQASSATPQPTPTRSVTAVPVVTAAPLVAVPNDLAVGSEPTTTPVASTPTKSKPGKDHSTKYASDSQTTGTPGSAVVAAASVATWQQAVGAISAVCQGTGLASVQLSPSEGYEATEHTSPVRDEITFDGPSTLSVRVTCSEGTPSFEILH